MSTVALVQLGGGNGVQKADSAASALSVVLRGPNADVTNGPETCTQFNLNGPLIDGWVTKTTNYSVNGSAGGDRAIEVDSTSGSVTITLPNPAVVGAGYSLLLFKKVASNNMVIAPFGGEKINGAAATKTVSTVNTIVFLWTNGTDWYAGSLTVL